MIFEDDSWRPHNQTLQVKKGFIQNNGLFMIFPKGQAAFFSLCNIVIFQGMISRYYILTFTKTTFI